MTFRLRDQTGALVVFYRSPDWRTYRSQYGVSAVSRYPEPSLIRHRNMNEPVRFLPNQHSRLIASLNIVAKMLVKRPMLRVANVKTVPSATYDSGASRPIGSLECLVSPSLAEAVDHVQVRALRFDLCEEKRPAIG